jgi:hypothetical protein
VEASLPLEASVFSIVAGLEDHDLDGLRRQWRAHLGGEPPPHLQRWLLMRVLVGVPRGCANMQVCLVDAVRDSRRDEAVVVQKRQTDR